MTKSIRRRVIALASVLAASVVLVVPATSSAALPGTSVSSVTWNVRTSWVNYLTNPAWFVWTGQGSVTPTGGARSRAAPPTRDGRAGPTTRTATRSRPETTTRRARARSR